MSEAVPVSAVRVGQHYATRDGVLTALDDCTLEIEAGSFSCIVGPSGCGKSTLLEIIAGLRKPTSGRIDFGGRTPDIAMVFQQPALFPWMTVLENVTIGIRARGAKRHDAHERAFAALGRVGLTDFVGSYPYELSGGMAQRVGIARALALEPSLLLMDEPFAAVDAYTRVNLQSEVKTLMSGLRTTTIFVTHDVNEALFLGRQVIVMSGRPGRIIHEIRPADAAHDASGTTLTEMADEIYALLRSAGAPAERVEG